MPDAVAGDRRSDAAVASANRRARLLLLTGAFLSFAFSVTLWFTGLRDEGLFVGLWVPSILSLGSVVLPPVARNDG